jgi:hypothetical protein
VFGVRELGRVRLFNLEGYFGLPAGHLLDYKPGIKPSADLCARTASASKFLEFIAALFGGHHAKLAPAEPY